MRSKSKPLSKPIFLLSDTEKSIFKKLTTPIKIQNFLDSMPVNWEKYGQTYMSPRRALKAKKMHCLEGALVAALALWIRGEEPLLMDLKAKGDDDHVVALYKRNGYWGAISKTNHATVRFRDPVYRSIRELAISYFHEYFTNHDGKKVLVSYSRPVNLKRFGTNWITAQEDLHSLAEALDDARHFPLYIAKNKSYIRPADKIERKAGALIEWRKKHPRT